jgi:outer membrane protein
VISSKAPPLLTWQAHFFCVLAGLTLAATRLGAAPAAQISRVRLGVLTDGPAPRSQPIAERFRQEIQDLLAGEFVVEEIGVQADWTSRGVRSGLERLLGDPSIDVVLAAGVLASDESCRLAAPVKPVIAPLILDARLQGCPLRGNASGVTNLVYVTFPPTLASDLRLFRRIVPFKRLALVHARTEADALEVAPARLEAAAREAGVAIRYRRARMRPARWRRYRPTSMPST